MGFVEKILKPHGTSYCAACGRSLPESLIEINCGMVCICSECMENADKYKSPVVFKGDRYVKNLIAAYPYSGNLRKMFGRYKFKGQWNFADIFAKLLIRKGESFIGKGDFDLLVPVPLSGERMRERGYNQSALIGEKFAEHFGVEFSEKALFRIRNTRRQSELAPEERNKNVQGAFLAEEKAVSGKKILLIDDIYTIGATMRECARTMLKAGAAEVSGICVFKTLKWEEKRETYKFEFE